MTESLGSGVFGGPTTGRIGPGLGPFSARSTGPSRAKRNLSLPVVSGKQVVKALEKIGFHQASQKGSHVKLRRADGRTGIVPMHAELREGTLRSILRQAHLSVEEGLGLLG